MIRLIGYQFKVERGIGYETPKVILAKSGLTMQSRVYSGGCRHAAYGRGG